MVGTAAIAAAPRPAPFAQAAYEKQLAEERAAAK
jgi:hypothetical protein